MHKLVAVAAATSLAACSSPSPPPSSTASSAAVPAGSAISTDAATIASRLAQDFGAQMQKISVLAPAPALRAELPKVYGNLLSPTLLAAWQAQPEQIIGREGSSPWPQRIEIARIVCARPDHCRVTGSVAYVTSNEVEHGGVFMRRPITLDAGHTAQGWRITAVHLGPARR